MIFHEIHSFSVWNTIFDVDAKYVPIKPLGKGSYGVVCSCLDTKTTERVAIKKIIDAFDDPTNAVRTLREITILRKIRHRNIIELKNVVISSPKQLFKDVYLVYELMDTDLDQIIKSPQSLTNDHCKLLLVQLLRGLNHLHSANILHRDLKPANILVNANYDLKICDFGVARTSKGEGRSMTEYVGTRLYQAPELLVCGGNYTTSIDVWSVGCIFAEMLGRKPIFPGRDSINQLKLILSILGTPHHNSDLDFIEDLRTINFIKTQHYSSGIPFAALYPRADPFALDLLQKMLVFNPNKRITISEALQHPYISALYDPSPAPAPKPLNIDIDPKIGEIKMRDIMWREMLIYEPEIVFQHL